LRQSGPTAELTCFHFLGPLSPAHEKSQAKDKSADARACSPPVCSASPHYAETDPRRSPGTCCRQVILPGPEAEPAAPLFLLMDTGIVRTSGLSCLSYADRASCLRGL
jgi:hypothetical protein